MTAKITIAMLILSLLASGAALADDGETETVEYFQSRAFNLPILDGWVSEFGEESAEFHLPDAQATIRATRVSASDALAAAEAELEALTGGDGATQVYGDKVNLADGTWQVLVYEVDEETTASLMARTADDQVVVISFVERDPAARTLMLARTRTDDAVDDPTPEIAIALEVVAGRSLEDLALAEPVQLPSGEWTVYAGGDIRAMGMVFGNDSFVALRAGEPGDLGALADAWNRTLLGFFITPDNSGYLALGLAAAFGILALLVGSYFWRERALRKDLALLRELADEK